MERIVDPKYRFAFAFKTDRPYYRKCYWENLYVFTYRTDRVLVATRVVPFTSLHEALYTAFKGQRGNTLTQHLLQTTSLPSYPTSLPSYPNRTQSAAKNS